MDVPKYQQIVNDLVRRIRSGGLAPGAKLPGHQKLARQFGVSSITAERALAELSRMGVVERRERAGSYVIGPSRSVSRVYVVVEHDIASCTLQLQDYWRAILAQAQTLRLPVQIVQADDPGLDEMVGIRGYNGQGLILLGRVSERLAVDAERHGIPCLYLGAEYSNRAFCVLEDRRGACRELARVLINDGGRRIGFVGHLGASNHRLARDGYLEATEPLGIGHRYIRDAETDNVAAVVGELLAEDIGLDSLIVMGANLPVAAIPVVLGSPRRVTLGFLTENSTVLHLGNVAYIAYYSQIETGKLAFEVLEDIAAGRLSEPAVRYSGFQILRPGQKPAS